MSLKVEEARQIAANADCLFTRDQVEAALDRMAAAVTRDLQDRDPLVLCVMLGGLLPAAKLIERLQFPFQYDYLHATRYRGGTRGGDLYWITRPSMVVRDRCILVVDDILDEGLTLRAIVDYLRQEGAAEVRSAALVMKMHDRRPADSAVDYAGLEVPDRYVFGYGMDYKGYLRSAAGIFALHES